MEMPALLNMQVDAPVLGDDVVDQRLHRGPVDHVERPPDRPGQAERRRPPTPSPSTSVSTTRAPCAASSVASALPIPDAAPVTTATLPVNASAVLPIPPPSHRSGDWRSGQATRWAVRRRTTMLRPGTSTASGAG